MCELGQVYNGNESYRSKFYFSKTCYESVHKQVDYLTNSTCEPNLQILLRCHITQLQPSCHGSWGPSSLWLFSSNFSIKGGSNVWCYIVESWKVMACIDTFLSPSLLEDILQFNLWWEMEYQGLYFGITMDRDFVLYKKGLRFFQDI